MTARNRRGRRLPRHRAWPLTTTDINEALGELASHIRYLTFLTGPDDGTAVLGVSWLAPEPSTYGRGPHPDSVGVSIDVHPVDAAERAATRAVLKATALPQLHEWITEAVTATETWQQTSHLRRWHLTDGLLVHIDDET